MVLTNNAETSHASHGVAELLDSYFAVKSEPSLEGMVSFYSADLAAYGDATLGWVFPDVPSFEEILGQVMPNWVGGRSYATRIIGDERSAMIAVTDTPELFGHEILSLSPVDFVDGKIVRWIDYWDARHFGAEDASHMRTPAESFPHEFGEAKITGNSSQVVAKVSAELNAALNAGSSAEVVSQFAEDSMTLHLRLEGRTAIGRYLDRALATLPYARQGEVLHVVGSDAGGGYESRAVEQSVAHGVVALELDQTGLVTRFTTVWDGTAVSDAELSDLVLLSMDTCQRLPMPSEQIVPGCSPGRRLRSIAVCSGVPPECSPVHPCPDSQ